MIAVEIVCIDGHKHTWHSQAMNTKMPWGNLLCACALLFSGSSPSKVVTLFSHLNTPMFSHSLIRTFSNIQRFYLVPSVATEWESKQACVLDTLSRLDGLLSLGGDGRCDSPGHTATYGTYSLVDLKRNLVITTQLVQVIEKEWSECNLLAYF